MVPGYLVWELWWRRDGHGVWTVEATLEGLVMIAVVWPMAMWAVMAVFV